MSSTKKKRPSSTAKSISDKISELLLPKALLDPEVDSADETTAKTNHYDDAAAVDDDNYHPDEIDLRLSAIRKGNVRLLNDVDPKYTGRIVSRKDLDNSSADEAESESEAAYEQSSDDDDDTEKSATTSFSMRLSKSAVDDSADEDSFEHIESDVANSADENTDDDDDDQSDDDDGYDETDEDEYGGADISSASVAGTSSPPPPPVSIKPADTTLNIHKGICVQNQMQIWEKLLETRIRSQKVFIAANSLPAPVQMEQYIANDAAISAAATQTSESVGKLLGNLCDLQKLLFQQYPETKDLPTAAPKRSREAADEPVATKISKYSDSLGASFGGFRDYRDKVLLKWHDRTKVLTAAASSSSSGSFNILQTIESVLANREELRRKTQLHKGGYVIVGGQTETGDVAHSQQKTVYESNHDGQSDPTHQLYVENIYDDTDFYHTQLRELIEFKANAAQNTGEMNKQFIELQKLRKKIKKVVDTRASKGRKIRYAVHNKMVNFMACHDPSEWTTESKNELYSSLFGARMQPAEGEPQQQPEDVCDVNKDLNEE